MLDKIPFPHFSHRHKSRFDGMFDDHLLVRDLVFVAFFLVIFSVIEKFWSGATWQMAVTEVIPILVFVLAISEAYARWTGSSMFRYFLGGDPFRDTGST